MNEFQPALHLWPVLTNLPGIGVSLMDDAGGLLFVNKVAMEMFFVDPTVSYHGKTIADFHSRAFVDERLALIRRVLDDQQPIRFRHIYKARHLESKIWPLEQLAPAVPKDLCQDAASEESSRVLVVTQEVDPSHDIDFDLDSLQHRGEERILNSEFIDLGFLNVLSPRELEVLVLLGHGLSVPEVAKKLFRSPKTIERHKTAIGQKLSVHGQAAITRLVTQIGLDLPHATKKRLGESE